MAHRLGLIFAISILTGCGGGSDGTGVNWRAIGQASCSLSMNCDPAAYASGGNGFSNSSYGTTPVRSNPTYKSAITIGGASLCPLDLRLGRFSHEQRSGVNKICFYL